MFKVGNVYRDSGNGAILALVHIDKDGDFVFKVLQDICDSYYSDSSGFVGVFRCDARESLVPLYNDESISKMFKNKLEEL